MSKASDQITVVVQTPLKRNGKRIAPSEELDMTIAEARPLLDVQAVLARDFAALAPEPDPDTDDAVSINTADAEALAAVSGIGEELAAAIVAHREANGAFESLASLDAISGIGPATIKKLADRLTV